MEIKSCYEFNLKNSTADIVKIIPSNDEILYFIDPWGRDSSSIPDQRFALSTFSKETEFSDFIKTNMYTKDYEEFIAIVTTIAGRKTDQ